MISVSSVVLTPSFSSAGDELFVKIVLQQFSQSQDRAKRGDCMIAGVVWYIKWAYLWLAGVNRSLARYYHHQSIHNQLYNNNIISNLHWTIVEIVLKYHSFVKCNIGWFSCITQVERQQHVMQYYLVWALWHQYLLSETLKIIYYNLLTLPARLPLPKQTKQEKLPE